VGFYRVAPLAAVTTHVRTKTTTTGQELQDLKTAYDKGIISQREYEQQRERLLNER